MMSLKAVCMLTALAAFAMITASNAEAGKEKFERCNPHCNVGTIGRVDHSKTLVRSQTQIRGFGTFTIRDRKTRTNTSRTYPMRIKTLQMRNKKTNGPAAANFPDMTPEEYREKWNLPLD